MHGRTDVMSWRSAAVTAAGPGIGADGVLSDRCGARHPPAGATTGVPSVAETATDGVTQAAAELAEHYRPSGPIEEELVRQIAVEQCTIQQYEAARTAAITAATEAHTLLHQHFAIGHPGPTRPASGTPPAVLSQTMSSTSVQGIDRMITTKRQLLIKLIRELESRQSQRGMPCVGAVLHAVAVADASHPRAAGRDEAAKGYPDRSLDGVAAAVSVLPPAVSAAENGIAAGWVACDSDEQAEEVFRSWRRHAGLRCPQCGSVDPPLELRGRRTLQCRTCGSQIGLRRGTLLHQSNIGFLAYHRAVRLLASQSVVHRETLRRATGLGRRAVDLLRQRVVAALRDPLQRPAVLAAAGWQPAHRTAAEHAASAAAVDLRFGDATPRRPAGDFVPDGGD